eukprot:3425834-Prymnesium_polylepis.1
MRTGGTCCRSGGSGAIMRFHVWAVSWPNVEHSAVFRACFHSRSLKTKATRTLGSSPPLEAHACQRVQQQQRVE